MGCQRRAREQGGEHAEDGPRSRGYIRPPGVSHYFEPRLTKHLMQRTLRYSGLFRCLEFSAAPASLTTSIS